MVESPILTCTVAILALAGLASAAAPGKPTGVTAATPTLATELAVSWTAPGFTGGAITRYKVKKRVAGGGAAFDAGAVTVGAGLTHTVTGLAGNTRYEFTVEAENADGWGDASLPSAAKPTLPAGVGGVAASTPTKNSLTVGWTASTGNAPITNYKILFDANQANAWAEVAGGEVGGTTTSKLLTGLAANTKYEFKVRAKNAEGYGAAGGASAIKLTLPGKVSTPTISAVSATQATVTWTRLSPNPASISHYGVDYQPAGGAWTNFAANLGDVISKTVTGLTPNTVYSFKVKALNSGGLGEQSDPSTPTPTLPNVGPTIAIDVTQRSHTSCRLTWGAGPDDGPATLTKATIKTLRAADHTVVKQEEIAYGTSTTVAVLAPGSTYKFQIKVRNAEGYGNYGPISSASTTTPAPIFLDATTAPAGPTKVHDGTESIFIGATWTGVYKATSVPPDVAYPITFDKDVANWGTGFVMSAIAANGNPQQVTVSFNPTDASQVGPNRFCLTAKDSAAQVSPVRCHKVNVRSPNPKITAPAANAEVTTYTDCEAKFTLKAKDADDAPYQVKVKATETTEGASVSTGLPAGATMAGSGSQALNIEHVFKWTPTKAQAAKDYRICFKVTDQYNAVTSLAHCVTVKVKKCKKCIKTGETLASIATEYKTTWMQLFSANAFIHKLNTLEPYVGREMATGSTYTAKAGEGFHSICTMFGADETQTRAQNSDVVAVVAGSEICVAPKTDTGTICEKWCIDGVGPRKKKIETFTSGGVRQEVDNPICTG